MKRRKSVEGDKRNALTKEEIRDKCEKKWRKTEKEDSDGYDAGEGREECRQE